MALDMGSLPLLPGAQELVAAKIFSSLQPANLRTRRAIANEGAALSHPAYPLIFDPQTAGGLLSAVPADRVEACLAALREAGYAHAADVGEVVEILPERVCAPQLLECRGRREAGYAHAADVGEVVEILPERVCAPQLLECRGRCIPARPSCSMRS